MLIIDIIKLLLKNFAKEQVDLIMTEERKTQIKKIADDLRKEYHLTSPDFNLLKFLTDYESFEIQLKKIDDETTGLLFVDDNNLIPNSNSHRVIVINQNIANDKEFEQKRRFICAHEYGHMILHKQDSSEFARRDTKAKETTEEKEAEYFAFCFLLPEDLLRDLFSTKDTKKIMDSLCNRHGMTYAEIISILFNVSIKKANCRLNELNLG